MVLLVPYPDVRKCLVRRTGIQFMITFSQEIFQPLPDSGVIQRDISQKLAHFLCIERKLAGIHTVQILNSALLVRQNQAEQCATHIPERRAIDLALLV